MKRILITVFALAAVAGFASAQELILYAGGGLSCDLALYNHTLDPAKTDNSNLEIGIKGFFDATFVQASVGVLFSGNTTSKASGTVETTNTYEDSTSYLTLSALVKYPFDVGVCTLFPLVGVEYDMIMGGTNYNGVEVGRSTDESRLFIDVGVGADFTITGKVFIRPSLLAGFKLNNRPETDNIEANSDNKYSTVKIEAGILVGFNL